MQLPGSNSNDSVPNDSIFLRQFLLQIFSQLINHRQYHWKILRRNNEHIIICTSIHMAIFLSSLHFQFLVVIEAVFAFIERCTFNIGLTNQPKLSLLLRFCVNRRCRHSFVLEQLHTQWRA